MVKSMDDCQRWTRYADFARGSAYSIFPQEHRDSRGRLPFHMMVVDLEDHDFSDPAVPETILAVPLTAQAGNTWAWNLGYGWHRHVAEPGQVLILPPDISSKWEVKGERTLMVLTVPSKTFRQIFGPCMPEPLAEILHPFATHPVHDDLVHSLMLHLWKSLSSENPIDRFFVDGALITLASHLIQRAGCEQRTSKYVALAPWRRRRVQEFVDAHLHEEIDITRLAEIAGLGVRHFSRAFREEVGETPHRWLMTRRIEKSMELMSKAALDISHVAEMCGFAGQSHFTRVFRQITGQTPKRWQNEQRLS